MAESFKRIWLVSKMATERKDDGTELSTHTLADGETSFTFTQTETSYATFNYIVKINGTQTDTYSATYTPPPTPTFDIALTNDDLAITATLTNIVNPDPYYTLMIHDANDTHLDGHTFATGDTTVTLTWTETSYGEKTYTKLLNGASIGTETITLTDPNPSTTPEPRELTSVANSGSWSGVYTYIYAETVDGNYLYGRSGNGTSVDTGTEIQVNPNTNIWSDYGTGTPLNVTEVGGEIVLRADGPSGPIRLKLVKPTTASWILTSTTTFNPPTSYTITGPPSNGYYPGYAINYDASKQSGTKYYYGIGNTSGGTFAHFHFYWDSSNNTWNDAIAGGNPSGTNDPDETYAGGGFSIKVGITSGSDYNTWLDASSGGPPTEVIENSDETVSLNDSSGNLLYKFTKPTSASWL
ncbi:unnamed protein product [Bathycoccus prasinos]